MNRVLTLYRTQIELMWRWRAGRVALLKRTVIALVAGVISFNLTAWLFPGLLRIEQLGGGLIAVVFIAALNLLIRPAILALVASRSVALLVILTLLFQAIAIWLLEPFVPSVTFSGGFRGDQRAVRPGRGQLLLRGPRPDARKPPTRRDPLG
jgi:uncharacterized membrane protein YvlD (DUF360 family)